MVYSNHGYQPTERISRLTHHWIINNYTRLICSINTDHCSQSGHGTSFVSQWKASVSGHMTCEAIGGEGRLCIFSAAIQGKIERQLAFPGTLEIQVWGARRADKIYL